MSTLHIIGEFFHNDESQVNFAAARDLTLALAETAPRGSASALLIAADTVPPVLDNPKSRVEKIPLRSSMLPLMWHSNQTARPLDGEFVHALTPLVPLRTRDEDDGSQSTVMVPHTLAWDAPEALPKGQARKIRAFTRRALKHADIIVTPTHAVAQRLREIYGQAADPQVLPLAAPSEYVACADAMSRREDLGLPAEYIVTTASPGETGRLEWLLRALESDPNLGRDNATHLVIIDVMGKFDKTSWQVLENRITVLRPDRLSDFGAILSGALLLAMPQTAPGSLYEVYGALKNGIATVHAGASCIAEVTLDAGVAGDNEDEFIEKIRGLLADEAQRSKLGVLARDRSRSFSWSQTAWQLWQIHAFI